MIENDDISDRSGRVRDRRPIVGLLYQLLRDHVLPGVLEKLVLDQGPEETVYSNGWLARYAQDLAARVVPLGEFEAEFAEACRSLRRIPTYEGWRQGKGVHIHLRIAMERYGDMLVFKVTGSCRQQVTDVPFDVGTITLEKLEQEIYACGDIAQFFEGYIVDQAFAVAEAKWIKHQQGEEAVQ